MQKKTVRQSLKYYILKFLVEVYLRTEFKKISASKVHKEFFTTKEKKGKIIRVRIERNLCVVLSREKQKSSHFHVCVAKSDEGDQAII